MTTPEELRTLVAEKVMGYTPVCVGADNTRWGWRFPEPRTEVCIYDWNPLESWADTGRVIERMADLGFTMTLVYGPHGDDVIFYHAEDGRYGEGKGKSVPRHISLAALRALGVEVE